MPQTFTFTDADFEYIREICRIPNKSDLIQTLVERCNALNAAQVTATVRDIEKYKGTEYGTEKSKGGIKGTDYDSERNRCQITDKIRDRLGYSKSNCASTNDPLAFGGFVVRIPGFGEDFGDEYSH